MYPEKFYEKISILVRKGSYDIDHLRMNGNNVCYHRYKIYTFYVNLHDER